MDFGKAAQRCEQLGGAIASIESDELQAKLAKLVEWAALHT